MKVWTCSDQAKCVVDFGCSAIRKILGLHKDSMKDVDGANDIAISRRVWVATGYIHEGSSFLRFCGIHVSCLLVSQNKGSLKNEWVPRAFPLKPCKAGVHMFAKLPFKVGDLQFRDDCDGPPMKTRERTRRLHVSDAFCGTVGDCFSVVAHAGAKRAHHESPKGTDICVVVHSFCLAPYNENRSTNPLWCSLACFVVVFVSNRFPLGFIWNPGKGTIKMTHPHTHTPH